MMDWLRHIVLVVKLLDSVFDTSRVLGCQFGVFRALAKTLWLQRGMLPTTS